MEIKINKYIYYKGIGDWDISVWYRGKISICSFLVNVIKEKLSIIKNIVFCKIDGNVIIE